MGLGIRLTGMPWAIPWICLRGLLGSNTIGVLDILFPVWIEVVFLKVYTLCNEQADRGFSY